MPLKRLSALFLAVGLLLAVPGAAVRPAAYRLGRADDPQIPRILQAFTDVQYDAWYAESLAFVYQRSLLEGTSASTFSPQLPMSRAMGVTALYRHAGAPELAAVQAYQDVSPDDWYGPAAAWARESGVARV